MQRKDLMEIKKRFKKDECTFTRMCGCYVNATKQKVVTLNEVFLNLPEEEYYKYMDIAKKALSGTMGNNLLELEFPLEEESSGGKQQFFMALKAGDLRDENLLDRFYDLVIENYDYTGNYLILLYHDAYDVMTKTEDGRKLDESEEVYDYIICALCPVTLSKPGLGYLEEENKIGVRLRDWIVGAPENGFLFPAFTDRSTDIHSLLFYTKNAKEPHTEFMEQGLGCSSRRTSMQQKKAFENVIKRAVMDTDEVSEDIFMSLQESICDMIDKSQTDENEPVVLTSDTFKEIIADSELSETLSPKIEAAFAEEFKDDLPTAEAILDTKALAKNEQKKKEARLAGEVENLKEALARVQTENGDTDLIDPETGEVIATNTSHPDPDDISMNTDIANSEKQDTIPFDEDASKDLCDVFLRVKPDKANLITSQIINGQKCLIIPVNEDDEIDINGIKMD